MLELACSPVSPGDATLTEEIHRLTRVTARGLHLPLQAADKRRRQGTQGQRQAGVGLWTEKVDIVSSPAGTDKADKFLVAIAIPRSFRRGYS